MAPVFYIFDAGNHLIHHLIRLCLIKFKLPFRHVKLLLRNCLKRQLPVERDAIVRMLQN